MSAPIETKVTVAGLTALVLPFVDATLDLLIAFGASISPGQHDAIMQYVQWQLPVIVVIAAYAAPHTFRHDLTSNATTPEPEGVDRG